jgi:glycosyltransferase involved in cell wall biosynthesis
VKEFSISLIIPTFNRASMLATTLAAIAESNFDLRRLEVVVVDDGSSDETPAIQSIQYPFSLCYLNVPNRGDALARNKGAQVSRGDLLVFLDDDITITPNLLASIINAHQGVEGVIVSGLLIPSISSSPADLAKTVEVHEPDLVITVPFTECQSGLFAISRQDFYRIGMWQPLAMDGSSLWCDIELGYRADLAGFSFIKSSNAIGFHHDFTQLNLETKSRRMHRVGKASVLLFQRHPNLKEQLPMFSDKTEIRWQKDDLKLIARKMARTLASTVVAIRLFERLYFVFSMTHRLPILCQSLERWILGGYLYRGYRQGVIEFGPITPA